MSDSEQNASKEPTPDRAEYEAYFPSPYSLTQYVPPRTDFSGLQHEGAVAGSGRRVLVIATEERYLRTTEDRFFSTGNHPVETLIPMHHLHGTGFEIDVATVTGYPAKIELWATPADDETVAAAHARFLPQLREPLRLDDVVEAGLDRYDAVFVPGGHGAMLGIPHSRAVKTVLDRSLADGRFVITLCHGPAALVAGSLDGDRPFDGYEVCVFPDALDAGANIDIGYLPGHLPWLVAETLTGLGVTVVNDDMTGRVHRDRTLLTGDSPLAADALGRLAVDTLLDAG